MSGSPFAGGVLRDGGAAGASLTAGGVPDGGDDAVEATMRSLLPEAAAFARAPVSGFRVGAVARGASGALYAGANLELAGMPLGCSVHAEQAAVANARRHGERRILAFAVTAAPCGHCRQFLHELADPSAIRILVREGEPRTLGALLPEAFAPRDLGIATDPLDGAAVALVLDAPPADPLVDVARSSAERAYAPYSGTRAGVALRARDGAMYGGASLESAAYNPSLPPLQDALVALLFAGKRLDEIEACALVETPGAISHRAHAEALLRALGVADLGYARASLR